MHQVCFFPLLVALLTLVAVPAAHGAEESSAPAPAVPQSLLPDNVLHFLFHVETNLKLEQLGNVSDLEGGSLKRTFLRRGHRRAAFLLQRWMVEAGMTSWIDAVGNVRGRTPSSHPAAPALLMGSHYDTVIDGGRFDGALGIVAGISAVKAALLESAVATGALSPQLLSAAVAGIDPAQGGRLDVRQLLGAVGATAALPRPLEVIAFSDEEGVRFQTTFLGSRALAGTLVSDGLLDSKDPDGVTLAEALLTTGMDSSPEGLQATALRPDQLAGYVELHIEQGPVLQSVGRRLGAVSAIVGQSRLAVAVVGSQGHAGTVPMSLRKDPLAAASEMMATIEAICGGGEGSALVTGRAAARHPAWLDWAHDPSLVCTVGSVALWPNASNVIPGSVNFTLDIRSRWDDRRQDVVDAIFEEVDATCQRRGLRCMVELKHKASTVECSPEVVSKLVQSVAESVVTFDRVMAYHRQMEMLTPSPDGSSSGSGAGEGQHPQQAEAHEGEGSAGSCAADGASTQGCGAGDAPAAAAAGAAHHDDMEGSGLPTPLLLVSGAGHDAMVMANLTPTGILFVRCRDGISHSPLESVTSADVTAGVAALHRYMADWLMEADSQDAAAPAPAPAPAMDLPPAGPEDRMP